MIGGNNNSFIRYEAPHYAACSVFIASVYAHFRHSWTKVREILGRCRGPFAVSIVVETRNILKTIWHRKPGHVLA